MNEPINSTRTVMDPKMALVFNAMLTESLLNFERRLNPKGVWQWRGLLVESGEMSDWADEPLDFMGDPLMAMLAAAALVGSNPEMAFHLSFRGEAWEGSFVEKDGSAFLARSSGDTPTMAAAGALVALCQNDPEKVYQELFPGDFIVKGGSA